MAHARGDRQVLLLSKPFGKSDLAQMMRLAPPRLFVFPDTHRSRSTPPKSRRRMLPMRSTGP
jgi:hypothetical protein